MDKFLVALEQGSACVVIFIALAGLALGFVNVYKAGVSKRKELESRAGVLKQVDDWDAQENQKAKELNQKLKEIGRA